MSRTAKIAVVIGLILLLLYFGGVIVNATMAATKKALTRPAGGPVAYGDDDLASGQLGGTPTEEKPYIVVRRIDTGAILQPTFEPPGLSGRTLEIPGLGARARRRSDEITGGNLVTLPHG